jgi:hypothetical protein
MAVKVTEDRKVAEGRRGDIGHRRYRISSRETEDLRGDRELKSRQRAVERT